GLEHGLVGGARRVGLQQVVRDPELCPPPCRRKACESAYFVSDPGCRLGPRVVRQADTEFHDRTSRCGRRNGSCTPTTTSQIRAPNRPRGISGDNPGQISTSMVSSATAAMTRPAHATVFGTKPR